MPPRLILLPSSFPSLALILGQSQSLSSTSPSLTARRTIIIRASTFYSLSPRAQALQSLSSSSLGISRQFTRTNSSQSHGKPGARNDEGTDQKGSKNQDAVPHVSEAEAFGKPTNEKIVRTTCDANSPSSPELEQGTQIDEIFRRDKDAQKYAPSVLKKSGFGSRSYSTSAILHQQELQNDSPAQPDESVATVENMIAKVTIDAIERDPGLKFDRPPPLSKTGNVRRRYEPIVEQFTKLIMRDGKLATAQKDMAYILDHLRTAPPPMSNNKRRLLTTLPPPQLPLNPIMYLSLIVDSVAPLLKIRQQRGIAGGGALVQIPVPLAIRQRRRTAIKWILDASDKRRDIKFAARVAQELVSVAEGRSGIWDKREQVHKLGVAGRSNLSLANRGRR